MVLNNVTEFHKVVIKIGRLIDCMDTIKKGEFS